MFNLKSSGHRRFLDPGHYSQKAYLGAYFQILPLLPSAIGLSQPSEAPNPRKPGING